MKALTCCYLACFFLQLRRLWALLPTPSPSPLASRSRLARETLVSSASIEFWSMTVDITALTQVRQLAQSAEKLLIGWQNKQPASSKTPIGAYLWPLASCVHLIMSHCSCGRGLFYLRVWGFSCQTCHIYSLFICLLLLLLITSPWAPNFTLWQKFDFKLQQPEKCNIYSLNTIWSQNQTVVVCLLPGSPSRPQIRQD